MVRLRLALRRGVAYQNTTSQDQISEPLVEGGIGAKAENIANE